MMGIDVVDLFQERKTRTFQFPPNDRETASWSLKMDHAWPIVGQQLAGSSILQWVQLLNTHGYVGKDPCSVSTVYIHSAPT